MLQENPHSQDAGAAWLDRQRDAVIFHRDHEGATSRFRVELYRTGFLAVSIVGKGELGGVKLLIGALEEGQEALPEGAQVTALIDISELRGAPVRAQFLLGRWLLHRRHLARGIAVYGGRRAEMALARAVMKLARMKNVGFFGTRGEAVAWLSSV